MRKSMNPIWLVVTRELRDHLRDWRILAPLLLLTILMPILTNLFSGSAIGFFNKYGGDLILDRLVPFSILIIGFFPITISLIIALESFVGEKERGTIEPLLSTPLTDLQLYLGKLIVGVATPLIASLLAITIYVILVSRQDLKFPDLTLFVQLVILAITHAILMVSGAIAISTQSTSVRGANLLASFIIIPVALMMQGETFLIFWGKSQILWLAILVVLILSALLIRLGVAHFQREALLGREIDEINFRWMTQRFLKIFAGEAKNIFDWYSREVADILRKLAIPLVIVLVMGLISGLIGFFWTATIIPEKMLEIAPESINAIFKNLNETNGMNSVGIAINPLMLFWHNIRTALLLLLFGLFSFSIAGIVIFLLNTSVVGAVMAVVHVSGLPAWGIFITGILPHGIFELPALLLSTAIVLRIAALLVTPNTGKSMSEVLLQGIAEWVKIHLGVVVPLFLIASFVEAYVTPQLLLGFLEFLKRIG